MKLSIENFTLKTKAGTGEYITEYGTAEVTIGSDTRLLEAKRHLFNGDHIEVSGIGVRVGHTGSKVWRGKLTKWDNGNITASREGNFRNPRGSGLTVVGFYETSDNNCQHSSQYMGGR